MKKNILFLCLFLLNFILFGMTPSTGLSNIRFRNFTVDDGLFTNTVTCIYQDPRGYLWFGTQDGVNLYDGQDFTGLPEDSLLSTAYIRHISQDLGGGILISSSDGLFHYDLEQERAEIYHEDLSALDIERVIMLSPGKLLLSIMNDGLFLFEQGTLKLLRDNIKINDFFLHEDKVYIATSRGLFLYETDSGDLELLYKNAVHSFLKRDSLLYAGTKSGIFTMDLEDQRMEPLLDLPFTINTMWLDSQSILWLGTASNGLIQFSKDLMQSRHFSTGESVQSLFLDQSDNLWVGFLGSGLSKIDIHRSGFSYLGTEDGLDNTIIVSIWEDVDCSLWLGTFGGGLYHYSPSGILMENYTASDNSGLRDNRIMSLFRDSRGTLWLGTKARGLYRFIDGRFIQVPDGGSSMYTISEDRNGRIWAISQGSGVFVLDHDGNVLKHLMPPYIPSLNYRTMLISGEQVLLGSVDEGLVVLNLNGELVQHYSPDITNKHGLVGSHVLSLLKDQNDTLWVGTLGGGLHRLLIDENRFESFTTSDGLTNNTVYGILQDKFSRLWLSTNRGLSLFDPLTEKSTNFTVEDGLQSNEFNSGASLSGRSGTTYMGGVHGLTFFLPEKITMNTKAPLTTIKCIEINNRKIRVGEDSGGRILLDKGLPYTDHLPLSQEDLIVTIHFRSLHYSAPEKNEYAYYLEGLEEDWNYVGDRSFTTYTNLPPGSYVLHYKSASNGAVWSDAQSIEIEVSHYFYQTLLFKIIMITGLALILLLVIRALLKNSDEKNKVLEAKVKDRTLELQEALDRERIMRKTLSEGEKMSSIVTLTTRLAHNLNTPLGSSMTAISYLKSSLENEKAPQAFLDCCSLAESGISQSITIVQQLTSASSAQALPTPVLFNLSEIIEEYVGQNWSRVLGRKMIYCRMDIEPTERQVLGSIISLQETLDSLISNSMSHGFKNHQTEDMVISFKVVYSEHEVVIIYKDNGVGIDENLRTKIFEPYVKSRENSESRGMGLFLVYNLIKSQFQGSISCIPDNDGACFQIKFPLKPN